MNIDHRITRRNFVKLCGALTLAASAPVSLVSLARADTDSGFYEQSALKMGTTVTITLAAGSAAQGRDACALAWAEMDRLIAVLDRHQPGTAVSELNAAGRLSDPGRDLLEVLAQAKRAYDLSGAGFDPTILPALDLIERSFQTSGRAPSEKDLAEALRLVGFDRVRIDGSGVRLGGEGCRMSLDGVAKGYIVDRTGAALRQAGIRNAMINAGGDILALGTGPKNRPWKVGIRDPFKPETSLRTIHLQDKAVATSGSYEVFYDPAHDYHHLLNPGTGRSADQLVSATVTADSAAWADAMATAAFIRPDVFKTAENLDGMIVARNGRLAVTPGFKTLMYRS